MLTCRLCDKTDLRTRNSALAIIFTKTFLFSNIFVFYKVSIHLHLRKFQIILFCPIKYHTKMSDDFYALF